MNSSLMLPSLLGKRLVLVSGKGGIGKTLVTAALGQYAARRLGKRVLIVEHSHRDQLAPLFGVNAVGHVETQVQPGLSVINLNTWDNFRDYVVKYLKQPKLFDAIFTNSIVKSFLTTVPGLSDVMMLGRLFYAAELNEAPERPDIVIFDSFASGHFLSLMTTPDSLISSGLGGPLSRETERVRSFLANPEKCGALYVMTPEELVVSEFRDFLPKIVRQAPTKIAGVIVNRLLSQEAFVGHLERQRLALQSLQINLDAFRTEFDLPLPVLRLAELGFVEEPLPPDFGPTWCEASST